MQSNTSAYIIDYPQGDMLRLHDLFEFWEIPDNISEVVHDRDIVAVRTNRKLYVA